MDTEILKKISPERSRSVFVGMSGGVDSSVSAALLKEAGYDVTGVFIKVWHPDWLPCDWKEERRDAMRAAAALTIPFLTLDLSAEYKQGVADYMIAEYRNGRTPNPDVMCNKEIKFGAFLAHALKMGADFIATGHYAQIKNEQGSLNLYESADKNKDQSYFLWTLTERELPNVLFPVGHLQKSEVRELARKFKLPTAEKKDSQGICFIGDVSMKDFLEHYIEKKQGQVLNEADEVIGTHDGAVFFTIGQRHGFTIQAKAAHDAPYYVVSKDIERNTITVSQKITTDSLKNISEIEVPTINWIGSKKEGRLGARIRYRQQIQECRVSGSRIIFTNPQEGISPGQSVVLYDGELCAGGAIIDKVF